MCDSLNTVHSHRILNSEFKIEKTAKSVFNKDN